MTVIKKSGKKEDYSPDKLSNSITQASQRTEEAIDVRSLVSEFNRIVSGKELITTKQIDIIVYGLLYSKGLLQTLVSFISYDEKDRA